MQYLPQIDELGFKYYFLYTLNSYDSSIEENVSRKSGLLETFKELSSLIGKEKVVWRYDPIVVNEKHTKEYHFKWFDFLADELAGYTDRCIVSFVDIYRKNAMNLQRINSVPVHDDLVTEFAERLGAITRKKGLKLYTCSHAFDLLDYGIEHSKCIDDAIIEEILGVPVEAVKDPGQRDQCGCIESRDIGAYDTCPHRCLYCYANSSNSKVNANFHKYDPESPLLCDSLRGDENISEYKKSKTLKVYDSGQGALF